MSAYAAWQAALSDGEKYGYRNSQVTVLAPTGTISFAMDCDTTGIEPDIALVKYKLLAGGGMLKIVNQTVEAALATLGYGVGEIDQIRDHIKKYDTIEDVDSEPSDTHPGRSVRSLSGLKPEHLSVFDCAFKPQNGVRSLHYMGHLKMMAACQPFLSGAISKCVTAETILTTDRGLLRIGGLYSGQKPDSFTPILLGVPFLDSTAAATSFYYGGVRPVWKVELEDGRIIRGTDVHRLRTAKEDGLDWDVLPDLQSGDWVALQIGTEMWGKDHVPSDMALSEMYGSQNAFRLPGDDQSEDVALFLGMLAADGHLVRQNYTIGLTKNCDEVRAEFTRLLWDLFGLKGRGITDSRNGVKGVTIGSKSLIEWLDGVHFSKQSIPDFILGGSRKMAVAWLSGFFLDGWISEIDDMAVGQKHQSLTREAQCLFDNLGIASYFNDNVVDGVNYPVLHILGKFRKKAANEIRWIEPHKAARAAALENGEDRDVFPMHRAELQDAIRSLHLTQQFRNVMDPRTKNIRVETFIKTSKEVGMSVSEEELAYRYVQVAKVHPDGEEEVFDISVPRTETFIGNGIVNHNTVNMPEASTVEEIMQTYIEAWNMGLKCVAIYRDGSKRSAPMNTKKTKDMTGEAPPTLLADLEKLQNELTEVRGYCASLEAQHGQPVRKKMAVTRKAETHSFQVGGHEGYLTVGLYDSGQPGEIFITMDKEGSTIGGLMDTVATLTSVSLQFGVPLASLVKKFSYQRYEPMGMTANPDIRMATSLTDYIFRWLACQYIPGYREETTAKPHQPPINGAHESAPVAASLSASLSPAPHQPSTAFLPDPCSNCGSCKVIRAGKCGVCSECGTSQGCS